MKPHKNYLIIISILLGFIFAGEFVLKETSNSQANIVFNNGEISFENIDNYSRIINSEVGSLMEEGLPEMPLFSTFYQIYNGIEYDIDYIVHQSHTVENINLYPEQGAGKNTPKDQTMIKDLDFYSSEGIYPEENLLISDTMIMRDVKLIQVSVIPFRYHPHLNQLEIFDQVEIIINETGESTENNDTPISEAFDRVYESFIINYERDDDVEYQQPAILYIGESEALNNSYFEDLVEWRKQRGYMVYTASTSETGTSTTSIKNYIENAYDNWEPRPDFVTLVGDDGGSYSDIPSFTEYWSGYNGEGDHPYTQLDGGDMMGEVFIGRISVRNTSTLNTVCNKIIHYEKATYLGSTGVDWYESAALIGDPSSSGISTVITNEFIQETLDAYGYEDIRTKFSGGSWSSWMQNQLSDGLSYFNYRGYWGTSGFGSGNIDGANNGWKLPFASVLTCGTGSFANENACLSEHFFRAGSVSSPEGAIASIGTATLGTHTAFNNAVNMGIYWGLFQKGGRTAGEALHYGKLHLHLTYPSNPSDAVGIFTHWNNLMGDAATHLWKDTPHGLNVDYSSLLPMGTNYITIDVSTLSGTPVENARVTLINNNESLFVTKLTDESGEITFDLSYLSSGNVTLTVTKQDFIPYQGSFSVSDDIDAVNLDLDGISVDEITGDNDGTINPGETIELSLPLKNYGSSTMYGIEAELNAESDNVEIITGNIAYGAISPGQTKEGDNFTLIISPGAIELEELGLSIQIQDDNGNNWSSLVPVEVYGARLIVDYISITNDDNNNGILDPGETGDIWITLLNEGSKSISGINGSLYFEGLNFDIIDGEGSWGLIASGETTVSSNSFTISANNSIINGSNLAIELELSNADGDGYNQTVPLHMQIGSVSETDPLGPDNHGYYIFDSGDLGYAQAPFYDWIEIDPDYGGSGNSLNFSDNGNGNFSNSRQDVSLPFDFIFYGEVYNEITVCSNGWITFGTSDMESFRNYPVPGAGGPVKMVAAFWDDLKTSSGGQVYTYYDPVNDYFIIEWSGIRTYYANSVESFQIILMDNSVPPYGDGEIKIQYNVFNNTSVGDYGWGTPIHGAYCTVGIEDKFGQDGLQYTFNNEYPEAAMTLHNGSALLITTDSGQPILMGDVNQDGELNILDVIKIVNHIINFELLDPLQQYMGDLNDDGMINILDVINLIINILDS